MPGSVHRAVHAESVVDKVALGQLFLRPLKLTGSWDSVVSIQTTGWRSGVRFQTDTRYFIFSKTYNQPPIRCVPEVLLPGVKTPGR